VPTTGATSSKCQSKFGQAPTEEGEEPTADRLEHQLPTGVHPPRLALQAAFPVQSQLDWSQHQPTVFLGHLQQLKVCVEIHLISSIIKLTDPYYLCSANMSYSSIWSPAIAPVSDLMSSNSCMQRAAYHHHQMASNAPPTGAACYPSQGYGASAYHYGNMDYHAMSAMPSMSHHSQLGASMSSAALNQMAGPPMSAHMNPMSSHGLHSGAHVPGHQSRSSPLNGSLAGAPNDCVDAYNTDKASWKFQVL